jgi:hypothetical protein
VSERVFFYWISASLVSFSNGLAVFLSCYQPRGYAIFSLGSLVIKSSCFIDNTFFRDAPVVVLAAEFVSEDNFGTEQTDLTCPFLAFFESAVDSDDGVDAICTAFEADECLSDVTGLEEDSLGSSLAVSSPLAVPSSSEETNNSNRHGAHSVGAGVLTIVLLSCFMYFSVLIIFR